MASGFWNIWKIPELRSRILFSVALLAVYRIGIFISTPGVDRVELGKAFANLGGTLFGIFNMFSGGAFEQASIFALGIMPYISSSIILQLLTVVIPTLERLQKEGESGRRKINQYTRYGTIVLSVIQGYGVAKTMETTEAELMHTVFPHPTLSEMMHESVLDAYGRAIHF